VILIRGGLWIAFSLMLVASAQASPLTRVTPIEPNLFFIARLLRMDSIDLFYQED
jgi:hypothetical protein